jgi:hypothetical protein
MSYPEKSHQGERSRNCDELKTAKGSRDADRSLEGLQKKP